MFCSKCGTENSDSARFCKNCGNPTGASKQTVSANNSRMASGSNQKNVWDCYLEVFRKYAVFNGRASRKEYWTFNLLNFAFLVVMAILVNEIGATNFSWIFSFFYLALFIPSLAVTIRRLHDTGRSGWMYFVSLIPLVGSIILLVFLFTDSTPGMNKYGPNPKGIMVN